ncbi:MAG TPA: beta-propeller fold lactonase family protein [Candidatus Acidoferrales bacterium]|nr:beta-propeller fold lactonase family protein [Candidatus Acidoferrales bacterium]
MRSTFAGAVYVFIFLLFCMPLFAQAPTPTFLFLLEGKGIHTGTVHVFSVNSSTGGIAEAPASPFNAGLSPNQLVADPEGRFLFATNEESQDITGFSVDPAAGTLTAIPGSPTFIGAQPVTAAIDPTGRFLYVFASSIINARAFEFLYEYSIDPVAGVLTLTATSPTIWESAQGFLISSITFNSAGNFAYLGQVAGGTMGAPTLICAVDFASGALSVIGNSQPADNGSANSIAISPSANFLYSIDSTSNLLDVFLLGSSGSFLTENVNSPYAVPNAPASLFIHPSGRFLYLASTNQNYQTTLLPSQYTGSITTYSVNSVDGSLTPLSSPLAAGINPVSVVGEPTGNFVYSASTEYTAGFTAFAQILGYSVNSSSGALTPFVLPAFSDAANSTSAQLVVATGAVIPNPVPMISSLNPPSIAATGSPFTLQVNGVNFVSGTTVYFGGQVRNATFISSTQLNVSILATDIDNGGEISVFVFNPLPGGGPSASVIFPVNALVPVITSTSPTTVVAGPGVFGFYCVGSNFTTGSVINFNGTAILTLYFGPNLVFGLAPAGDLSTPGNITVTVTTASNNVPGGGTSNAATISVTPAVIPISVSTIFPSSAIAGGAGLILTVLGNGFVAGSQVTFNLQNVFTTFVSSTELIATIPGSAIAVAGNPYVIVANPGGAESTSVTFTINNPPPATVTISPQVLPAGSNALTLNVTGTSFAPNSIVLVNGGTRPTTYRNSSQVQATLLPSDLQQSATLNIAVSTPPPGGGTTATLPLTVYDYRIIATTPSQTLIAGSQANFDLTLTAANGTFSHSVALSVSGLPPGATASFTPASIPAGSGTTGIILSIETAPHSSGSGGRILLAPRDTWMVSISALLVAGALWICLCGRSRKIKMRPLAPAMLMVWLLITVLGVSACSGLSNLPPAKPNLGSSSVIYAINIVATSGIVTINTQITLTVMQ